MRAVSSYFSAFERTVTSKFTSSYGRIEIALTSGLFSPSTGMAEQLEDLFSTRTTEEMYVTTEMHGSMVLRVKQNCP